MAMSIAVIVISVTLNLLDCDDLNEALFILAVVAAMIAITLIIFFAIV